MDKYALNLLLSLGSLIAMIFVLFILNLIYPDSSPNPAVTIFVTALSFVFSSMFLISGLFLWVTGFRRFEQKIGKFGFKWLLYVAFNILAGMYLQFRYGSELKSANKLNKSDAVNGTAF